MVCILFILCWQSKHLDTYVSNALKLFMIIIFSINFQCSTSDPILNCTCENCDIMHSLTPSRCHSFLVAENYRTRMKLEQNAGNTIHPHELLTSEQKSRSNFYFQPDNFFSPWLLINIKNYWLHSFLMHMTREIRFQQVFFFFPALHPFNKNIMSNHFT